MAGNLRGIGVGGGSRVGREGGNGLEKGKCTGRRIARKDADAPSHLIIDVNIATSRTKREMSGPTSRRHMAKGRLRCQTAVCGIQVEDSNDVGAEIAGVGKAPRWIGIDGVGVGGILINSRAASLEGIAGCPVFD